MNTIIFYILVALLDIFFLIKFRKYLIYKQLFDMPGKLKTHILPVPKSSGVILFLNLILLNFYINMNSATLFNNTILVSQFLIIFNSMFLLIGLVSIYDDIKGIHYIWRLLFQFIFVILMINSFYIHSFDLIDNNYFFDLPKKMWMIMLLCSWIFFINSTNFIDGIDSYFCFYSILASTYYIIIYQLFNDADLLIHLNLVTLTGLAIMLFFNITKKNKFFAGDVGTIFVGSLMGFNFTYTAIEGFLVSNLIIHSYVIIDVGYTLVKKIFKQENIFIRHRSFIFFIIFDKYRKKGIWINNCINFLLVASGTIYLIYFK
jgi:UDP-GlcNAc:undecaprenyl-phosphate/decaprenyl-phosphate GlcNAc-1-phosphate transferase